MTVPTVRVSGMMPERASDPGEAGQLLAMAGACIVPWPALDRWAVVAAGEAVLGARLRARWEPRTLRPHADPGRRKQVVRAQRLILEGTAAEFDDGRIRADPSAIAVEGWGLGDGYPDVVAFLCAAEPVSGGEDYLVDSVELMTSLGATAEGRALRRALWTSPVQLRTHPQHAPQRQPMSRRTRGGRLATLYAPSALLPVIDAAGEVDSATLAAQRWHELVAAAAADAPRFALHRDEALLVDNYRVYHGRDGYTGERVAYRGWFWSDAVFAYPMVTEDAGEP